MKRRILLLTLPILLFIFFIGFYLRMVSVFRTTVIFPLRADAGRYLMYAYNVRHKHTYSSDVGNLHDLKSPVKPDAIRSPGYPLFLALFVDGPPNEEMIDRIIFTQAMISVLTLIVALLFFRCLLVTPWAVVGSLLVALSPHLIVANSYILTETLFCFFLVLLGWLTSSFGSRPPLGLACILGIFTGLVCLVRPSLQFFPIIMAFPLVFRYGWQKGIHLSGLLLLGFALSFSPWIVRNMMTLGTPGDSTLTINFLHHGMYPNFTYDDLKQSYGFPYRYDPRSEEIGKDVSSVIKEIARRFNHETSKHLKWFFLQKPLVFWSWNMVQGAGDAFVYPVSTSPYFSDKFFRWTRRIMYHGHWPIVLLALFGCVLAWFPLSRLNMEEKTIFVARFVSVLLAYFTFLHMVGAPFPRYSVPLRPFLYGMALFPPLLLIEALKRSRLPQNPLQRHP